MTGHLLGAAGEVGARCQHPRHSRPGHSPTINVENQDPEVDLDVVPNVARDATVNAALSNSFGFGGHNAAVLVTKIK